MYQKPNIERKRYQKPKKKKNKETTTKITYIYKDENIYIVNGVGTAPFYFIYLFLFEGWGEGD